MSLNNKLRLLTAAIVIMMTAVSTAQERRIASPAGISATEVGGRFDVREGYVNGKWIEIRYGRPIKRSRNIFDLPDSEEALMDGAEVWRAGANVSTRLLTEIPLQFGSTRIEPGEYTVFINFADNGWEFVLSNWPAQLHYDYENHDALWGAYEYTPDRDVVRVPMIVERIEHSYDQLSWQFIDMQEDSGGLIMHWDKVAARVSFDILARE